MRKALYILSELEDQDLVWLADNGRYRHCSSGEVLIEAGKQVQNLYIVIEGGLDIVLPSGKQLNELAVGDIVGEMSLVEKMPPSTSVVVAGDSKLLEIPHGVIEAKLKQDVGFAARFYRALAVFFSDRMRSLIAQVNASDGVQNAEDQFERENEIDEMLLDNLHLAGDRMLRLIALLETPKNG